MNLSTLKPKHKHQRARIRVGRGGKRGTTSGKGTKGQKSRAGRVIRPAERDYIQRLPKLRGYKNKPLSEKGRVINVGDLVNRVEGTVVNPTTAPGVMKVLGGGELKKAFTIEKIKVSASARKKIEAAGGKVLSR